MSVTFESICFHLSRKMFRTWGITQKVITNTKYIMSRDISLSSKKLAEAVEELQSNPFYNKYAHKIATLQKTSPEDFLSRIEANINTKSTKTSGSNPTKKQTVITSGRAKPLIDEKHQLVKTKLLKDYMKLELLLDKTDDEIKQIWLDYHRNKDVIAAVIPKEVYLLMHSRGQEFNTFLLPLPRDQGYEFIVCQFYGHEIHFTPLIAYQTHKENAPECLTMVHYSELAEDKGIVLMKGDYNTDVLQAHEAQCLINELQLYYGQNNDKRLDMLKRFTYTPNEFKHMELIADMECLTI